MSIFVIDNAFADDAEHGPEAAENAVDPALFQVVGVRLGRVRRAVLDSGWDVDYAGVCQLLKVAQFVF